MFVELDNFEFLSVLPVAFLRVRGRKALVRKSARVLPPTHNLGGHCGLPVCEVAPTPATIARGLSPSVAVRGPQGTLKSYVYTYIC